MSKILAFSQGASGNVPRSQTKRSKIKVTSVRRSRSVDAMIVVAVRSSGKVRLIGKDELVAFRRRKERRALSAIKSNEIPRVMDISVSDAQELSFKMLSSLDSKIQDEMFDECE